MKETGSVQKEWKKDFRASEDDFVIAATDRGLNENEIKMQMDDLHATHISDPDLIDIKRQIEEDELDLISLKQNRQIYVYSVSLYEAWPQGSWVALSQ